jgi:serine phosphatase RsbU (regulator of sigma subunit)
MTGLWLKARMAATASVVFVAWLVVAVVAHTLLAVAAAASIALVALVSGSSTRGRTRHFANVSSAAEVAQRAVLRPLPGRLGPLELGVVYLAAAADAQVGGDLYEVVKTPFGIRLIIGDVRGKGLGAVEIAADVLGMFREVAHEVHTLAELARRLDAGLTRQFGEFEEFVTAVFAEIDPAAGQLTIYNCGHPPPMLISGDTVTVLEVPAPAPPLGLLTLADASGAGRNLSFLPNGRLLLYTDGVTEARDRRREFYPLDQRLAKLTGKARTGKAAAGGTAGVTEGRAGPGGVVESRADDLLEQLREDLLRYAGAPLADDAAMLLVRAPATWPSASPRVPATA